MNVAEMKTAGKGSNVDPKKAQIAGYKAKGAALATLCINFAVDEVKAEEKRGEKRRKYIADIYALTPEGHAEFRAELRRELLSFDESEKALVQAGMMKEQESKKGGYSSASFRVMVSNWSTLSVACEAGLKPFDEDGAVLAWDAALSAARTAKKAQQAAGNIAEGQRASGAGRKAVTDYDKALRMVSKLNLRDQRKLAVALAGMIEASETKAPKRSAKAEAAAVH